MDQLACVDVPALPLQLLLREHPDWRRLPVAVVDDDKPQGVIRWVNRAARQAGILPGLRYGTALGLSGDLRAGTVSETSIQTGIQNLIERLQRWSPAIEPAADEPGLVWLDAGGLAHVFPSLSRWADDLRQDLHETGLVAGVAVGFSRFGTYAAAKALQGRRSLVFPDAAAETKAMHRVPLQLIGLPPSAREALSRLGIRTVGAFLDLPADGILRRFGPEAHRLHRFASGDLVLPLRPVAPSEPIRAQLDLDYRETDISRLTFVIKHLVDRLLARLVRRGEALGELALHLTLDDQPDVETAIRLAEPTVSSVQLVELARLRLDALGLSAAVTGLRLTAIGIPASPEQLQAFAETPRRDPAAAVRAFARVRAAFGDEAVVRARLLDRHAPEARFTWEPFDRLPIPAPSDLPPGPLVRRFWTKAEPLPTSTSVTLPMNSLDAISDLSTNTPSETANLLTMTTSLGPVRRLSGPYSLSGGWWRAEVQRDYYFAELHQGGLLWVYYDRMRRRWFLQGEVT